MPFKPVLMHTDILSAHGKPQDKESNVFEKNHVYSNNMAFLKIVL